MLTAKLWGLNDIYTRNTSSLNYKTGPGQKKWQAPEILANREASQKSDVYVIYIYFIYVTKCVKINT